MRYVYILQSLSEPARYYTGVTDDLSRRLARHNSGQCSHASKHAPWKIMSVIGFEDAEKALRFEQYLKSGSGRAFAKRHF